MLPQSSAEGKPKLTNLKKIKLIEDVLEREIRPSLRHDGGDVDLIDVVGNRVIVATRGQLRHVPRVSGHPQGVRGNEAEGDGFT